mgnify:FL=1
MEGQFYKLEKKDIGTLVDYLARAFEVWAPAKDDGELQFAKVKPGVKIQLEYGKIQLGPKQIFFPHQEVLFQTKKGKPREPKIKPVAVLGAHPVDLIGLQRLDESFGIAPQDYYWQRRRKNSVVIGIEPKSNHYFSDTLAYYPIIFDLFLHFSSDNYYLVEVNPRLSIAQKIIQQKIFSATSLKPKAKTTNRHFDQILSDPLKVSQIIENSKNSKVWLELGKICLNCGICAFVCPLCYCFNTKDTISASGDECKRCRYWDACVLAKFSEISGGYNFRDTPGKRLYNWYYHKFVRAVKERGKIDCIGCHRCIDFCPAKINFRKVIEKLAQEQEVV